MKGRRTAAMLCVLLLHALLVFGFFVSLRFDEHRTVDRQPAPMELFFIRELPSESPPQAPPPVPRAARRQSPPSATPRVSAPNESAAITTRPFVDWPVEAKESAARVLAAEREAERIAKMFAGPDGTWASLTKRQRSQLSKFRWAPGVDGLARDDNGNYIYTLPNGCAVVNFIFFGCPLGKAKIHDDMFENMRLYFDEQRLPQTDEGNGTEPESKRPPKWSKPLP